MAFTHIPPTKKEKNKNKLLIGQKYFTALQKTTVFFCVGFFFFRKLLKTNASDNPDVFAEQTQHPSLTTPSPTTGKLIIQVALFEK